MRETAERELSGVSMNGYRGHSTPTSPSIQRSNHLNMSARSPTASPTRLRASHNNSTNLQIGNMESMLEELKAARLLNRTV